MKFRKNIQKELDKVREYLLLTGLDRLEVNKLVNKCGIEKIKKEKIEQETKDKKLKDLHIKYHEHFNKILAIKNKYENDIVTDLKINLSTSFYNKELRINEINVDFRWKHEFLDKFSDAMIGDINNYIDLNIKKEEMDDLMFYLQSKGIF